MSIIIKTEKIIARGVQKIKIIELDGLDRDMLPTLYTNGEHVYVAEENLFYDSNYKKTVSNSKKAWCATYLQKNEILKPETFDECLKNITRCGNRLAKINKKLNEENKNWHGIDTFYI